MIIEYLKMDDFRQFKGSTEVHFSCDPEKNVTVILGDNTFGKTTLLQAFNWCFYGEVNLPNADHLLNYEVERNLPENVEKEVVVEIGVMHQKNHYTIKRTQIYRKSNGKTESLGFHIDMWYKEPDGQTNTIKGYQIPEIIGSILPKDLSSYFFFDTERVQDVGERTDLSAAVKGLLGLQLLDNAKKHLGSKTKSTSVIGQFYGESAKCSKDPNVDKAMNQIQVAEEKKRVLHEEINELDCQIKKYEERISELDQILVQAKATKELQKNRAIIEARIRRDTEFLDKAKIELRKKIGRNYMDFFATPLAERATALLKIAKVDDKGVKDLTAVTLNELLKRGVCVCGQKLEKGNEAYEHVCEAIRFVPPASIGTIIKNYKEELTRYHKNKEKIIGDINEQFNTCYSLENAIEESKDQRNVLSKKIEGQKDMSCQESERRHAKYQVDDLHRQKMDKSQEVGALTRDIETYTRFIEQHQGDTEKSKQYAELIAYAESVCAWIQKQHEKKEGEIRERLQAKVNEIFDKIYTGKRKVVLDDTYHVKLLDNVNGKDIETGESEGLRRVKNFAFIAGLVALAKEKITTDAMDTKADGIKLSAEPYPLVMDAPFSNADEFHTANISRVLPEVAEQVIMFVMKKDWNYAKVVMDDKVGARYKLNKLNEVHTTLEVTQNV